MYQFYIVFITEIELNYYTVYLNTKIVVLAVSFEQSCSTGSLLQSIWIHHEDKNNCTDIFCLKVTEYAEESF